jgi:hypothetical protein
MNSQSREGIHMSDYDNTNELTDEELELIEDEYEYDEPDVDELTEWMDFDPDC